VSLAKLLLGRQAGLVSGRCVCLDLLGSARRARNVGFQARGARLEPSLHEKHVLNIEL
jgi:hypothetical protein